MAQATLRGTSCRKGKHTEVAKGIRHWQKVRRRVEPQPEEPEIGSAWLSGTREVGRGEIMKALGAGKYRSLEFYPKSPRPRRKIPAPGGRPQLHINSSIRGIQRNVKVSPQLPAVH